MLNWPLLFHDNADLSGADYVSPWDCCVSAVDSYVGLPGSMGYSTCDAVNILLGWTAISFDDDKDKNPNKKNNLSFNRRLRVVPHFSEGIVERAKRERAWKSPHARKGDTPLSPPRVAFSRVGWFSRALAFCSLYYPWGKMGDYS